MATNEVLLLQPVENLGNEGDTVKVRAGYARNFLFPRKMALPMTRANRKQMEALIQRREERLKAELEQAEARKQRIEALSIAFSMKTGQGGKLFGSVTNQQVGDRLKEEGIEVDRHKITFDQPVKELGQHTAYIKLHAEVTAELKFDVVSENPIEEEEGAEGQAAETTEASAEKAE